ISPLLDIFHAVASYDVKPDESLHFYFSKTPNAYVVAIASLESPVSLDHSEKIGAVRVKTLGVLNKPPLVTNEGLISDARISRLGLFLRSKLGPNHPTRCSITQVRRRDSTDCVR